MAKVTVLISTVGERINQIILPESCEDVLYVVVHQQPRSDIFFDRDDVVYIPSSDRGLSKSRNIALQNCFTKYGLICDDDVLIDVKELLSAVEFAEFHGSDIVTCRFAYSDGNMKVYPENGFIHNIRSLTSVCSIEILVKAEVLHEGFIAFDEKFGLGTSLPSGEEYIFLSDALKAGLEIRHSSCVICVHPPVTSGMDFFTTKEKIKAKREMLCRVFGRGALLVMLVFFMKKFRVLLVSGKVTFFARNFFSLRGD